MKLPESTLALHLGDAGYSLTKPRRLVFEALDAHGPITMHELTTRLYNAADRSSIYRTVALFEKLGVVQRVSQGWKYKLELTDMFTPHHHHMTCISCRRTASFDEPEHLEELLLDVTAKRGFLAKSHSLEIEGLCSSCLAK